MINLCIIYQFIFSYKFVQTPDGALLDILRNAYDLLSPCNIELPVVRYINLQLWKVFYCGYWLDTKELFGCISDFEFFVDKPFDIVFCF